MGISPPPYIINFHNFPSHQGPFARNTLTRTIIFKISALITFKILKCSAIYDYTKKLRNIIAY